MGPPFAWPGDPHVIAWHAVVAPPPPPTPKSSDRLDRCLALSRCQRVPVRRFPWKEAVVIDDATVGDFVAEVAVVPGKLAAWGAEGATTNEAWAFLGYGWISRVALVPISVDDVALMIPPDDDDDTISPYRRGASYPSAAAERQVLAMDPTIDLTTWLLSSTSSFGRGDRKRDAPVTVSVALAPSASDHLSAVVVSIVMSAALVEYLRDTNPFLSPRKRVPSPRGPTSAVVRQVTEATPSSAAPPPHALVVPSSRPLLLSRGASFSNNGKQQPARGAPGEVPSFMRSTNAAAAKVTCTAAAGGAQSTTQGARAASKPAPPSRTPLSVASGVLMLRESLQPLLQRADLDAVVDFRPWRRSDEARCLSSDERTAVQAERLGAGGSGQVFKGWSKPPPAATPPSSARESVSQTETAPLSSPRLKSRSSSASLSPARSSTANSGAPDAAAAMGRAASQRAQAAALSLHRAVSASVDFPPVEPRGTSLAALLHQLPRCVIVDSSGNVLATTANDDGRRSGSEPLLPTSPRRPFPVAVKVVNIVAGIAAHPTKRAQLVREVKQAVDADLHHSCLVHCFGVFPTCKDPSGWSLNQPSAVGGGGHPPTAAAAAAGPTSYDRIGFVMEFMNSGSLEALLQRIRQATEAASGPSLVTFSSGYCMPLSTEKIRPPRTPRAVAARAPHVEDPDAPVPTQALLEDEALTVIVPVLHALAFLHGKGTIHRDVKPDNILLHCDSTSIVLEDDDDADADCASLLHRCTDYDGALRAAATAAYDESHPPPCLVVKLGDLGIAQGVESAQTLCGTGVFMAPEVLFRGRQTTAVDIYSAGVTLQAMMTQEDAHLGRQWLLDDPPPPPRRIPSLGGDDGGGGSASCQAAPSVPVPGHLRNTLSPAFVTFVNSMVDPDPQRRPSAETLLEHPLLDTRRLAPCNAGLARMLQIVAQQLKSSSRKASAPSQPQGVTARKRSNSAAVTAPLVPPTPSSPVLPARRRSSTILAGANASVLSSGSRGSATSSTSRAPTPLSPQRAASLAIQRAVASSTPFSLQNGRRSSAAGAMQTASKSSSWSSRPQEGPFPQPTPRSPRGGSPMAASWTNVGRAADVSLSALSALSETSNGMSLGRSRLEVAENTKPIGGRRTTPSRDNVGPSRAPVSSWARGSNSTMAVSSASLDLTTSMAHPSSLRAVSPQPDHRARPSSPQRGALVPTQPRPPSPNRGGSMPTSSGNVASRPPSPQRGGQSHLSRPPSPQRPASPSRPPSGAQQSTVRVVPVEPRPIAARPVLARTTSSGNQLRQTQSMDVANGSSTPLALPASIRSLSPPFRGVTAASRSGVPGPFAPDLGLGADENDIDGGEAPLMRRRQSGSRDTLRDVMSKAGVSAMASVTIRQLRAAVAVRSGTPPPATSQQ